MADDSGMVVGAITQATQSIEEDLFLINDDMEAGFGKLAGLSDKPEDPVAQLKIIIEKITGISDAMGIKESAQEADPSEGMAAMLGGAGGDDGGVDSKPGKNKPSVNDVAKLKGGNGMGSILIYNKLVDIEKMLNLQIAKLNKDAAEGKKGKGGGGGSGGGGDMGGKFDPKEIAVIAKGLREFAKAAMILALIPKKLANAGLDFFLKFLKKYFSIFKQFRKDMKNIVSFNKSINQLAKGLDNFALACIILTLTSPFIFFSTFLVLPMVALFMKVIIWVMKGVKKEMKNFYTFSLACILLGVAFILMAVAFMLMAKVGKSALEALLGLGLAIAVFVLVAVIAYLLTYMIPAFAVFAFACILMSVAFILMTLAIRILSNFRPDWENVQTGLDGIVNLIMMIVKLLPYLILGTIAVVFLTAFSALFMVSMLLTVLGLLLVLGISALVKKNPDMVELVFGSDKVDGVVATLAKQIGKNIGWFLLGTVSIIFLTAFSALFLASMLLTLLGMLAVLGIYEIVTKNEGIVSVLFGNESSDGAIPAIAKQIGKNIETFLLGTIAVVFATAFAALFMGFSLAMMVSMAAMSVTYKILKDMGSVDPVAMGKRLKDLTIGVLFGAVGMTYKGGSIGFMDLIKAGVMAAKMAVLAVAVKAAMVPAAIAIIAMASIVKAIKYMDKNIKGIDEKVINNIFDGITNILNSLAAVAEGFKGQSEKAILAVGQVVLNVADALNKITDIVIRLKDGIPESQITAATTAMLSICEHLFGVGKDPKLFSFAQPPEEYTLIDTFQALSSVELTDGSVNAARALAPLMEGIGAAATVIELLSDEKRFSHEKITLGMSNLNAFIGLIKNGVVEMIKKLSEAVPSGEFEEYEVTEESGFLCFKKSKTSTEKREIKKPIVDLIKEFVDKGFTDSLRKLLLGLVDTMDALADYQTPDISNISNFFTKDVFDMLPGMFTFKLGLDELSDTLIPKGGFAKKAGISDALKAMSESLISMSEVRYEYIYVGMKMMVDAAPGLSETATELERLANAMGHIANSSTGNWSIFDKLKNAKEYVESRFKDIDTAASEGIGRDVHDMAEIIRRWDAEGLPISDEPPKEGGTPSPDKKGNGVMSWLPF